MVSIVDQANIAFADFNTPGVPASGEKEPVKAEIRAIFPLINAALSDIGLMGAVEVAYETVTLMEADLSQADGTLALVWGDDSSPPADGVYIFEADSPAHWEQTNFVSASAVYEACLAAQAAAVGAATTASAAAGTAAIAAGTATTQAGVATGAAGTASTDATTASDAADAAEADRILAEAAAASALAAALPPYTLDLMSPDHTTVRVFGTPNPITGSSPGSLTEVMLAPLGKAGNLIGVGGFGINSGGTIYIGRYGLSAGVGGTTTARSEFALVIPAGTFYKSVAASDFLPVAYEATDHPGFFTGGATTSGKIGTIANSAPSWPFYTHAGHVTTTATTGAIVTNTTPQIYFVFELEDGTREIVSDALNYEIGKTIYWGRDTTTVQAASSLTDNASARFNPRTAPETAQVRGWSVGANAAGQGRLMLMELDDGGGAGEIILSYPVYCSGAANNTFHVDNGTFPTNVWVKGGKTVRGYFIPVTGGFGLTYSAASSTVGSPGHEITVAASTGLWGDVAFSYGSGARRYEDRLELFVPAAKSKRAHQPTNGVLIDEDFSEGTLPPNLIPNGGWTVSVGYAQPSATGLANGLELDLKPAANQSNAFLEWTNNASTDHVYVGLMDATGNYSTIAFIDASTDSWGVYNAWLGGTTFPATKYDTKFSPFTGATLANTTRRYRLTQDRDDRIWKITLEDQKTGKKSEIKVDLTTWVAAANLADIGMMHGGLYVGNVAGSSKFSRLRQEVKDKTPFALMLTDSMYNGRADTSASAGYRFAHETRGGGVLVHVDGTPGNSARILAEQHIRLYPTVEWVILNFGMNDDAASRTTFQAQMAAAVRICLDAGKKVALCTVVPMSTDALPYAEINDDIRSIATTYGCRIVPNDLYFSVGGDGVTRYDPAFSVESGSTDVHWQQTVGHPMAYDCLATYVPELGLKVPDLILTCKVADLPVVGSKGQVLRVPNLGGGEGLVHCDSSGVWRRATNTGMETVATNANSTWTPLVSAPVVKQTGTLTADRTVTLSTTGAYIGLRTHYFRTGSGAFNLIVGGKNLATNTCCTFEYDGSAWVAITGVSSL